MGIGTDIVEELAQVEAEGGQTSTGGGYSDLYVLFRGLPTATKMALFFTAVGLCALAAAVIEVIANLAQRATSWIPYFGKSVATGIAHGAQWLTNRVGVQYAKFDAEVSHGLTELNTELKLLGADVLATGFVAYKIAQVVVALSHRPNLAPRVTVIERQVKPLPAKVAQTGKRVSYITKVYPKAVPRYLTQRLQHLEREVQHQQEEIAALRQQVKAPSHPSTLAQAVPVVALGLAGLGLNAARCEGPRAFNEALCEAGPQGLGNLLALLEAGLLLMGLVPLAEASIAAIGDVTPVVHEIWGVTGP